MAKPIKILSREPIKEILCQYIEKKNNHVIFKYLKFNKCDFIKDSFLPNLIIINFINIFEKTMLDTKSIIVRKIIKKKTVLLYQYFKRIYKS